VDKFPRYPEVPTSVKLDDEATATVRYRWIVLMDAHKGEPGTAAVRLGNSMIVSIVGFSMAVGPDEVSVFLLLPIRSGGAIVRKLSCGAQIRRCEVAGAGPVNGGSVTMAPAVQVRLRLLGEGGL